MTDAVIIEDGMLKTRDRNFAAWLLLFTNGRPNTEFRLGHTGREECWFGFPDPDTQQKLLSEYDFSREKHFADNLKTIQAIVKGRK